MSLADLLVRRLTHDFAGPVGAIGTAVEMGVGSDPELEALIADGAAGLAATLQLYRFIATPNPGTVACSGARRLVATWLAARGNVRLDWPGDDEWPADIARLTAGLAVVAADTRASAIVVARGRVSIDAAIEPGVAAVLRGAAPITTRHAIAGLLAEQAAERSVSIEVADGVLSLYQASALPR